MEPLKKFGQIQKQSPSMPDMGKINAQTLVDLSEDEVFVFRVAACNDQVDRDYERFTKQTLQNLAKLYVGRPMIVDHNWTALGQTARIYDAGVETKGEVTRLMLSAYMVRNEHTAPVIAAIEAGILREVSVGCQVAHAVCNICGADKTETSCSHCPGMEYDGKMCVVDLDGAVDAYEVSFCAVPSQPGAGVTKSYGGEGKPPHNEEEVNKALAKLELEKIRFFGGSQ